MTIAMVILLKAASDFLYAALWKQCSESKDYSLIDGLSCTCKLSSLIKLKAAVTSRIPAGTVTIQVACVGVIVFYGARLDLTCIVKTL